MQFPRLSTALLLALGLALSGCDSVDHQKTSPLDTDTPVVQPAENPTGQSAAQSSSGAGAKSAGAKSAGAANRLTITLKTGDVVIDLADDVAPQHAQRLKALADAGKYDNVAFHRVIEGFMAQTGDVQFGDIQDGYIAQRAGTGGSSHPDLKAEFSDKPFVRGTVGMARSQNPDSANSQFFIMFDDGAFLNGQYTVVGSVVSGMEHVDQIKRGDPNDNGSVSNPDRMIKVR